MFTSRKKNQLPGGPSSASSHHTVSQPEVAKGRARMRAAIAHFHEEQAEARKSRSSAVAKKLDASTKEAVDA